jgi:hypothetical protein
MREDDPRQKAIEVMWCNLMFFIGGLVDHIANHESNRESKVRYKRTNYLTEMLC